jgi:hypothetical protein
MIAKEGFEVYENLKNLGLDEGVYLTDVYKQIIKNYIDTAICDTFLEKYVHVNDFNIIIDIDGLNYKFSISIQPFEPISVYEYNCIFIVLNQYRKYLMKLKSS